MADGKASFIKKQTKAKDFEIFEAKPYDEIKDCKLDPSGYYILVKILKDKNQIAVAVCNKNHEIEKEFRGKRAIEIWNAIFNYEEKNNKKWFTTKQHIAYIGKELNKAEIALKEDSEYIQE